MPCVEMFRATLLGNWNDWLSVTTATPMMGRLASPGHAASHDIGVTTPPTKVKIGAVSITVFFSTQVGATEGIEAEVQARLKSAKKIRVIAMLISDPGILAS